MTAARPVVSSLFERGAFTADDSAATAAAIPGPRASGTSGTSRSTAAALPLPDRLGQGAAMASMLTPDLAG